VPLLISTPATEIGERRATFARVTRVSLIAELQRRRVFRAVVGYGIASFAVLQVIEPIMHGLRWPDEVVSYVVFAWTIGSPAIARRLAAGIRRSRTVRSYAPTR
jgi:hypothetical protein